MRRVILLSVVGPSVPYFSKLSHKRYDFRILNMDDQCQHENLMFYNRTTLPGMTKKKSEAFTVLSSQIKTKKSLFLQFYDFNIDKDKTQIVIASSQI